MLLRRSELQILMQESVDAVLNDARAVHHWYVFETLRDRGTSSGKYGQDEMTAGTGKPPDGREQPRNVMKRSASNKGADVRSVRSVVDKATDMTKAATLRR